MATDLMRDLLAQHGREHGADSISCSLGESQSPASLDLRDDLGSEAVRDSDHNAASLIHAFSHTSVVVSRNTNWFTLHWVYERCIFWYEIRY